MYDPFRVDAGSVGYKVYLQPPEHKCMSSTVLYLLLHPIQPVRDRIACAMI
jgi:hypothetical protein